ncbi:helix-turn-helix domain-containing protein [Nonomuraea gerenzanensis]|uniref:Helix-turn-helix domain-containing protein n=1 Tax=Nonomuraea gerenzanensis TaxID=93944 RepID=A0A1M4BLA0_9ACTN|nr:helix-turn-helix domain-containing protein [Nonomuraea gerenzanensis]UBU09989.1 helix-turn-helix domain-containing protein [Nonomuraea gerenzanensis]SAP16302.1 hypothetical protein BN4615_P10965 [Nonomuraea gerenzanensis]
MKSSPKVDGRQQQDDHLPLLLTIPQVAKELGLKSRDAVYDRIRSGQLRAVDVAGPGSTRTLLRVPADSLRDYIRACPEVHNP